MPKSSSYVLVVLGILRSYGPLEIEEIANRLFEDLSPSQRARTFSRARAPEGLHRAIRTLMQDLVELEVVTQVGDGQYSMRNAPPRDPAPPGNSEPPEGSGLAQVLAHPFMFSYPNEDFEEVVERTLTRFGNE